MREREKREKKIASNRSIISLRKKERKEKRKKTISMIMGTQAGIDQVYQVQNLPLVIRFQYSISEE